MARDACPAAPPVDRKGARARPLFGEHDALGRNTRAKSLTGQIVCNRRIDRNAVAPHMSTDPEASRYRQYSLHPPHHLQFTSISFDQNEIDMVERKQP